MEEASRKLIYFASDAHLGNRYLEDPLSAEKKLVRWLDSIKNQAIAIYFLGDMFDYWYEYKYVVPKGSVRFLGKIAELADSGIEIHLLIGNHDIWMFDYLPNEIGAKIHQGPLIVNLLGKQFFLAHGDEIGKHKPSFRFLQAMFRNRTCQFFYSAIHPRWTFGFAKNWSLSSRKNGLKKRETNNYDATEYLITFAKENAVLHPEINYYIFGHSHSILDLSISDTSRLLISGDWMQYFSYIQWDGDQLLLNQFEG